MSKIASIKHYDIANGEKIRTSIFLVDVSIIVKIVLIANYGILK